MKEIILASASPRRAELLKQLRLNFRVTPSDADETLAPGLGPEEQVQNLAVRKAMEVAEGIQSNTVVIGADTVVVKDGRILGKPRDPGEAEEMLQTLRDTWHQVLTGVAVIDCSSGRILQDFECTRVKMKPLSRETIKAYIQTGEPMDKAGSYGIQGMGAILVERIEGCYFNVVGLPLARLASMLEEYGVRVL